MITFRGFAPDADEAEPGVITDCTNLIPSERGMVGGPSDVVAVTGLGSLAAVARGAAVLTDTSGTRRTFAGTQTKLYELASGTWADVSRVGDYTGSNENRWSFAQFGNAAIAANQTEKMQATTSGSFADITAAPAARIVLAAKDFVLAFSTNETTYGDSPDRWWCSGFQDHTDWTPSVTTQCTTGRLVGVPGGIVAGAMLGSYAVAYKPSGLYLGQYVGAPVVWQWDQVPGEVGCVGPEAVVDIGGAHFFVGPDNLWMYDGTRPTPVATGTVRQWFFDDVSATYLFRTIVTFDRQNSRVWIFYPSASSSDGTPDHALVYHLITKQWGRANRSIQCAMNFTTPGVTWDTLDTLGATWDTLPDVSWDSQTWAAGGKALAVIDSTNALVTLNGASVSSGLTTGDMGDEWRSSLLSRARLRFTRAPTTASATGFTRDTSGGALVTRSTNAMSGGKFDLLQDDKWHRLAFTFTGDFEVRGLDVQMTPTGAR